LQTSNIELFSYSGDYENPVFLASGTRLYMGLNMLKTSLKGAPLHIR